MCTVALSAVLIALAAGCVGLEPAGVSSLETEGEVVVFFEPLPQSARHLRFDFDLVSIRTADDTDVSLALDFREAGGLTPFDRQKRLAAGRAAPGAYDGLTLQLSSPRLLGEDGEAELLFSSDSIFIGRPFEVHARQATALFLRFDDSGLAPGGVVFEPAFSLHPAKRQLFNLNGYVSDTDVNRLTVFNKTTMRATDVIATGAGPAGVAVAPRRRRVYVACTDEDRIDEIDIVEGAVVGSIALRFGDGPKELAVSPNQQVMVATNHESDTISIIDLAARVEIARVNVGRKPLGVVIDQTGSLAFVVNSLSNSVSVIDIERGAVAAQLPTETTPLRAVVEPGTDRLFVIHRNSPNLMVFDARRLLPLGKIFAGPGETAITRDPTAHLVYVGNLAGDIQVIAPEAMMVVDTIRTGPDPLVHVAFEEEESSLYAIRRGDGMLLKIDSTSKRVVGKLELGEEAYAVAVIGAR
jgi:YVTN family beta-propeller protein